MIIIQKHLEFYAYCRDEPAINAANGNIVDFNADNDITDSFKIKEKIASETGEDGTKKIEIMVPLK